MGHVLYLAVLSYFKGEVGSSLFFEKVLIHESKFVIKDSNQIWVSTKAGQNVVHSLLFWENFTTKQWSFSWNFENEEDEHAIPGAQQGLSIMQSLNSILHKGASLGALHFHCFSIFDIPYSILHVLHILYYMFVIVRLCLYW